MRARNSGTSLQLGLSLGAQASRPGRVGPPSRVLETSWPRWRPGDGGEQRERRLETIARHVPAMATRVTARRLAGRRRARRSGVWTPRPAACGGRPVGPESRRAEPASAGH